VGEGQSGNAVTLMAVRALQANRGTRRVVGLLKAVGMSILLGRAIVLSTNGTAQRLRTIPRALLFAELGLDTIAIGMGCGIWFWQHCLGNARAAPHDDQSGPDAKSNVRIERVNRLVTWAAVLIHLVRHAIYLSPSRGLRPDSRSER
jgi:hypothetical protein